MLNTILGSKIGSIQRFTDEGKRIPVTQIKIAPCYVVCFKKTDKDGYNAVQLGWGEKKLTRKSLIGQLKGAKLKKAPVFLAEVRVDQLPELKPGDLIEASDIFKAGDSILVTGWAKGKGFTGVMKRWNFKGGPRTHGQSNRPRSIGSIGQTTSIGRVFPGKKMPGRSGGQRVTMKGLKVISVDKKEGILEIKGLVPGARNGRLIIKKKND